MSSLRTIRAFAVEMMKTAAEILDADIRKLLSERQGKEYLDGGRLLTNTAAEAEYALKMAADDYSSPLGLMSSGSLDVLQSHKKKKNQYQKVRDYTGTALKGGLTGLGVLGATNAMRGHFGSPSSFHAVRRATHQARSAATLGAGIAVADKAYRHDELPGEKKAFAVSPNLGSNFKSPARSLMQSNQTGGFRSGIVHDTGKAPQSLTLGKKFHLP